MNSSCLEEKKISGEKIFDGSILHIYKDQVRLADGHIAEREYNRHIGAVCIIPVDSEMNVVLEYQFRYATGQVLIEIPAGKLNHKNESPEEAGRRELIEETGITAERFIELGYFYPAAAYSDERIMMYLAEGLSYGKDNPDEDEFLEIFKMPLRKLLEQIDNGNIPDLKTQAAAMRAARYYKIL